MFTGIIETIGKIESVHDEGPNRHLEILSDISGSLQIDQSVNHNGVCLTVTQVKDDRHTVTAVSETLQRSNLKELAAGSYVNLERSMPNNGRFDGHIVQGHVDTTAKCNSIIDDGGSWLFTFFLREPHLGMMVEKGSICLNGVSLTCFNIQEDAFSVTIIPYTFENSIFGSTKIGDNVNVEFDIIGKYVAGLIQRDS